jgi:hypothetical protein
MEESEEVSRYIFSVQMLISYFQEFEPSRKSISAMFFEPDVFAEYMNCTVTSCAGEKELEVREGSP